MTLEQVPEHIWIELIISDLVYEMYVPQAHKTEKIKAAYAWRKELNPRRIREHGPTYSEDETSYFKATLIHLDVNGSSEEHKRWRQLVNAHVAELRNRNI